MGDVAHEAERTTAASPATAGLGQATELGGLPAGFAPSALRRFGGGAAPLLYQLQRTAGNQAVNTLVGPSHATIQRCACGSGCRCAEPTPDEKLAGQVDQLHTILARSRPDRHAVRAAAGGGIGGGVAALQRDDEESAPDDGAVALDDAPAGGGSSTPTFDHSGGSTVTINADTAIDFANNITATIGSPHVSPSFEPDIQFEVTGGAAKKITSIGLTVRTAITKVRYGMGRANDKHKAAIKQMVEEIKAHEEKHRAIIETEAATALAAAQKKFLKTGNTAGAQKALSTDLECATNKKHEALDASEGKLTAAEQSNGDVTVTKSGSGARYPCP
jgi:hypothetical protein